MIKVGQTWYYTMPIGWAQIKSTIVSRNGNMIVEKQEWHAEDTGELCSCEETREIKIDDKGREYIVMWEYHGEKGIYYGEE